MFPKVVGSLRVDSIAVSLFTNRETAMLSSKVKIYKDKKLHSDRHFLPKWQSSKEVWGGGPGT